MTSAHPLLKDRYRIGRALGAGGMGRVFEAVDQKLSRTVAIKMLPRLDRLDLLERFANEARAIARLNHPNIVIVYDYDETSVDDPLIVSVMEHAPAQLAAICETRDSTEVSIVSSPGSITLPTVPTTQPFIVMEYLPGHDINDAGLREPGAVLDAVVQVCDALEFAHDHGIVHRDIKPENIRVLPSRRVKLVDFGIAMFADATDRVTRSGELLGTFVYMSPEQALGQSVDARTDIYSLALVTWELLTGELPFRREGSPIVSLTQRVSTAPRRLRELRPELPRDLEHALDRALDRDRDSRTATIGELGAALRRIRESLADRVPTRVRGPESAEAARAAAAEPAARSVAPVAEARTDPGLRELLTEMPLLVGRGADLERAEIVLDRAWNGHGGAIFVGGEPGVGKSALARALIKVAVNRGFQVLRGRVLDESRVPFEPFLQMIRADLRARRPRVTRRELGSDLRVLGHVVHDLDLLLAPETRLGADDEIPVEVEAPLAPLTEPPDHHALLATVRRYLERRAADRPLLVFLESFHDADHDSVATLRRLLEGVTQQPWLLLVEHCVHGLQREEPFHAVLYGAERDNTALRLDLARLSVEDTGRLVGHLVPEAPDALVAALHHVTGGLPIYVIEVLRALEPAAGAPRVAPSPETVLELAPPHSVSESVARVLDAMDPAHEKILRPAAVIGRFGFQFDTLVAMVGRDGTPDAEDAVIDALEAAASRWLVRTAHDQLTCRFDCGLVWRTVYDRIHPRRRARMHARAIDALEPAGFFTAERHLQLAWHHAMAAGRELPDEVVYHLECAAEMTAAADPLVGDGAVLARCVLARTRDRGGCDAARLLRIGQQLLGGTYSV